MNSRLKQIPNWPELTQLHRYCVATLAEHLGCSRRQLGRYIRRTQRQSAAVWLNELRQTRALELLRAHHRVTDVGRALHYKKSRIFRALSKSSTACRPENEHSSSQCLKKSHIGYKCPIKVSPVLADGHPPGKARAAIS